MIRDLIPINLQRKAKHPFMTIDVFNFRNWILDEMAAWEKELFQNKRIHA